MVSASRNCHSASKKLTQSWNNSSALISKFSPGPFLLGLLLQQFAQRYPYPHEYCIIFLVNATFLCIQDTLMESLIPFLWFYAKQYYYFSLSYTLASAWLMFSTQWNITVSFQEMYNGFITITTTKPKTSNFPFSECIVSN